MKFEKINDPSLANLINKVKSTTWNLKHNDTNSSLSEVKSKIKDSFTGQTQRIRITKEVKSSEIYNKSVVGSEIYLVSSQKE